MTRLDNAIRNAGRFAYWAACYRNDTAERRPPDWVVLEKYRKQLLADLAEPFGEDL